MWNVIQKVSRWKKKIFIFWSKIFLVLNQILIEKSTPLFLKSWSFHREYEYFSAFLACKNSTWIEISKNFNFFGKKNHNSTQKSAALSIKLLSKITFFTISLFSDSSGRFWKKWTNFFKNPMVYPIKFFDFSHNSTQKCSAPCRKKTRKFSKKGAQFWSKLIKKMLQNWSRKIEKKSIFSFFFIDFFFENQKFFFKNVFYNWAITLRQKMVGQFISKYLSTNFFQNKKVFMKKK